ncbi:hypothetical protein PFISCL1PPCAC_6487, partial [Pristionchus fissidentatus]
SREEWSLHEMKSLFLLGFTIVLAVADEGTPIFKWQCANPESMQKSYAVYSQINQTCSTLRSDFEGCCNTEDSCRSEEGKELRRCLKKETRCFYKAIFRWENETGNIKNSYYYCADNLVELHRERKPEPVFRFGRFELDKAGVIFFSIVLGVALTLILCIPICVCMNIKKKNKSNKPVPRSHRSTKTSMEDVTVSTRSRRD